MMAKEGGATAPQDRAGLHVASVEILRTYNRADMAIIESVLSANGINHIVAGGNIHYSPMKVLVEADQVGAAYELVKKLKLSYTLIASGSR